MTSSDLRFNIKPSDLGRMNLGALLQKRVVVDDPVSGTRVWEFEFENATVQKTEWYGEGEFLSANAEEINDNDGQRFGDMRKVASVPMHVWAREIAPRLKDGNDGSLKRWLNSSDNRPFRTFKGNI